MRALALLALLAACATEPAAPPPPSAPAAPATPTLPAAELKQVTAKVLAPSPRETRDALAKAGIQADVARLVPRRAYRLDAADRDIVAVRTGVLLADAVLTVETASDADLVARLEQVEAGLAGMGAGEGLRAQVRGAVARVRNGGVSRADLLAEIDDVVGMAVPGGGVGPDDRSGPLLQAGAWLASSHLVAQALIDAGRPELADQLLHQQAAAEWFLGYVRAGAEGRADADLLRSVERTLVVLATVAGKPSIPPDDVRAVRDRTAELLALL